MGLFIPLMIRYGNPEHAAAPQPRVAVTYHLQHWKRRLSAGHRRDIGGTCFVDTYMRVFIGSATESIGDAQWLAAQIEQCGHEALPWYSPGLFRPGDHTLASLERVVGEVDAAAFVFSEDDKTWYRGAWSSQTSSETA